MIPFNVPYVCGTEITYISESLRSGKLAGDGQFTKKVQNYFEKDLGFKKTLFTTSCTDALEMCALLLNITPGDEVILPSYTFVSTANAFALRGATLRFADSQKLNPNISPDEIERLISPNTKAIVVVHYAGVACNMDSIMAIANAHGVPVIEDAAQGISSYYRGRPLGSIGTLGTFSFHETKNITCGEGGLLAINDERLFQRSEIVREKGTNRSAFFRGEVDKYGWVEPGSSFLGSDILAAFLFAQLQEIENIQSRRLKIWNRYDEVLRPMSQFKPFSVAHIPDFATNNAHMYYIVCDNLEIRSNLSNKLKENGISASFHYQSLHNSSFFSKIYEGPNLPYSDHYQDALLRLPLYNDMSEYQVESVLNGISSFFA